METVQVVDLCLVSVEGLEPCGRWQCRPSPSCQALGSQQVVGRSIAHCSSSWRSDPGPVLPDDELRRWDLLCVHMAIGQLADYARFVEAAQRGILVLTKPRPDLLELTAGAGVAVIWPEGKGYDATVEGVL
jgi:hypothetical protein